MLDARALIGKHRSNGVLVDTNLLVLLLVGSVGRANIQRFKRTQDFTVADFDLLLRLIAWLGKLVTTPHVLSQVSDLTDLKGANLEMVRGLFAALVQTTEELWDSGRELVSDPLFFRLGLTDAAISRVCARGILILTSDLQLYLALQERGVDALHFGHVRMLGWI